MPDQLPPSPITFETLVATMSDPDLTDLQRRTFLDEHLHRRVEWDGTVRAVKPGNGVDETRRYLLELSLDDRPGHTASCWFSTERGDDLLALKPEQKITVSGVLENYDASGPSLVGCQLKRL